MRLAERIGSIAAALPLNAAITIPASDLRDWIAEEGSYLCVEPTAAVQPERWLTADECAERLNVTPRWCYDHADELGAKKLSRRCVRFSEKAVTRHMASRA